MGVIRTRLLTRYFGANWMTDSFIMAWSIPSLIINLFTGTIYLGLVPKLVKRFSHQREGMEYFWNIVNGILISMAIICLLLFLVAQPILTALFNFQSVEQNIFTRTMLWILIPTILFQLCFSAFNSLFTIHDHFVFPGLLRLVPIFFSIVGLLFYRYVSLFGLAAGITGGNLIILSIAFFFFKRKGAIYRYHFTYSLSPIIKEFKQVIPLIITQVMIQVMFIVDRVMASYLSEGDVSILHYGMRLNEMVFQGFVLTLIVPLYPLLSQVTVEKNFQNLVRQVSRGMRKIFYVTVPLSVILILGSSDLITILYKSKHFIEREVGLTANILSTYAIGLVFMGVNAIFFRVFIALGKLRILMVIGITQALLKIILNVVFLDWLGLVGLPLSTVVATLFWTGAIIVFFFRWSHINISFVSLLRYCFLLVLGIILYYIVTFFNELVSYPNLWLHGIGIIVSVIIGFYGVVLLIDRKSFFDVLRQ